MAATTYETFSLDNWTGRRAVVVVRQDRTGFDLYDYKFNLVKVDDPDGLFFGETTWQIMVAGRQIGTVVESATEVYAADRSWEMTRSGADRIEAAVRLVANLL
jgi:hypothetical protein